MSKEKIAAPAATDQCVQISEEQLVARLEAGETLTSIRSSLGLSRRKLEGLLDSHGLMRRNTGPVRRLPKLALLVQRIEAGELPRDIAAEAGVSVPAVHRALLRGGVTIKEIRSGDHLRRSAFGMPAYVFTTRGKIDLGGRK